MSELVSTEKVQDQRGHAPSAGTDRLVARLVGTPPAYRPCPRAVSRLMEGCDPSTEGVDLIVRVRCRCWSCSTCRERRRWVERHAHVHYAAEWATHVWRGSSTEWTYLFTALSPKLAQLIRL